MKKRLMFLWLGLFASLACFSQQAADEASRLRKQGLQNVNELDSSIYVHLLYASTDNFMKENIYGSLTQVFLQPKAAQMLVKAQQELKKQHASLALVVYDAARPQRMQAKMWEKVKGTSQAKYVTSPGRISMHSYGVAVDVSIVNAKTNSVLDMGTPVDHLGVEAEPRRENEMLKAGKITQEHINNRSLLRSIMRKAGFRGIPNEWWHFEACTRVEAEASYTPIK